MRREELQKILDKHLKWLKSEDDGERADLRGANLQDASLQYADLRGADLRGANLQDASLQYADLRGANLRGANLQDASLQYASLQYADLRGANLQDASLQYADLRGANLQGASLQYADLRGAKISKELNELLISYTSICPEGTLVGWKKCKDNIIVKLEIPADARRCNATGRKCRAEYVKVLEVIGAEVGISQHDNKTEYKAGEMVYPDKWDEDRWNECSSGIHFFIARKEAEDY